MKQIQEITIWNNGKQNIGSILNASIVNDNLESSCYFSYQICEAGQGTEEMPLMVGLILAQGNVSLSGEEYLEWDGNNDYAYSYIANELNLTII